MKIGGRGEGRESEEGRNYVNEGRGETEETRDPDG